MKHRWIKLLLFLIPALAGTFFVLWRFSPEQAVVRRAEALFASLEKKTLESATTSEKAERLLALLHPDFSVQAPLPIPSGPLPPDRAAARLHDFHDSIASSRISRTDQRVTFPSDGRAIYEATLQVDVAIRPNSRSVFRYRCQLEFQRHGRDWRLHRAILTPL